jgi:hypothetical protein
MKPIEIIFAGILALAAGRAGAQATPEPPSAPPGPEYDAPPAAPAKPPAPPAQEPPDDAQAAPSGQWVYTEQYGWVWMPYGAVYSYVPPAGTGEPYAYVYYPSYGWTWVVAPWIWGYGPWPFFGVYGPAHFAWYGYGFWRTPWRWHYRPAPAPFHGAVGIRAFRPAPSHVFVPHGAPGGRGSAGHPPSGGAGRGHGGHR